MFLGIVLVFCLFGVYCFFFVVLRFYYFIVIVFVVFVKIVLFFVIVLRYLLGFYVSLFLFWRFALCFRLVCISFVFVSPFCLYFLIAAFRFT